MNVLPRAGRPTITNASLRLGSAIGGSRAIIVRPRGRCGGRAGSRYDARPMAGKPTPYWDYIKVEPLLALQSGIGDGPLGNDETMFIVVHQIDELWFKLILREMVAVRDLFARAPVPEQALASAVRGVRRMETIVRQLAG